MTVTTWSLELTDPSALRLPARPGPVGVQLTQVHAPALNADLYRRVGAGLEWTDRLSWSPADWEGWAARVETWVATLGQGPAGFFELDLLDDASSCEIAIFGVLPEAQGVGLGGLLLARALERGLELAPRVWVHTCSLDGPHALANYRARGMAVFAEERT